MHKIERLLQTLAPKGVEFKTLEEIFEIKNGYTPSKNNPEFWEKGTIPWFRMEDIRENGRILKDSIQHITPKALKGKKLFPKNSIIISTTATIGEHALLIVDSLANQRFTFLSKKANCNIALDMKFFFYQCFLLGEWCKKNTNVSGFASVDMTAFKKYKFPIPPLEIQQEIVKILDAFTELNTELNTELKARKKQYEYYQNMLLDFNDINQNHKDAKEKLAQKTYPKRLQTLLQTLAPKGVEFRKLGEVINILKGKQLNKELLLDYGEYPVMNGGIHASGYWNEYNTDYPKIIISQGGASAGYVNYMTSKFWAGAHCYAIELNSEKLNYKFLYYFLKNSQTILMKSQFGAGIPALNKADIETLTIPIPPLEIQQEIVKILDAFTELNTELNTELKARKKQYEYYQNMLLDFNDINQNHKDAKEKLAQKTYPKRLQTLLQTLVPKGVEFRKLWEVCDFQKGKSITKKAVTFGKVPVISGGRQPAYYHNEANRSGETIAISSSGVYAGYVSYWDIPVFLADSFSVSPKQKTLMPKYLFHYLTTQQDAIHATKSTGGIPHVYSKDLQNFLIPIPPLEIQQEIVKILDQFLALTTDLLAGIPAEIEARKKQYEYYREKLLTFKSLQNKE